MVVWWVDFSVEQSVDYGGYCIVFGLFVVEGWGGVGMGGEGGVVVEGTVFLLVRNR